MSNHELDAFTADIILDAAARGELSEGFEDLGALLTAFHEPASASEAAASLPAAATLPTRNPTIGRLTRRTAVAASAAFFTLSGVAAALTGGAALLGPIFGSEDPVLTGDELPATSTAEESKDTVFNFGYDEELHLFAWNTSTRDDTYDCTLENGPVNPSYAIEDGVISIDGLTSEVEGKETEVTFPHRNDEGADRLIYTADGDCALDAAEVTGPNGQINHGMFMKLFNSLYGGSGRGCLNRDLAQSDLGKGDQQINVGDVDPDFQPVMDGVTGEIVFDTFTADCDRENNGNGKQNDSETASNNGGGSDSPGRPDSPGGSDSPGRPDSPGRSGDAHDK